MHMHDMHNVQSDTQSDTQGAVDPTPESVLSARYVLRASELS